jgi:hypothetical protein
MLNSVVLAIYYSFTLFVFVCLSVVVDITLQVISMAVTRIWISSQAPFGS